MAGVVVEVRVQEGHEVKAGDPILVLSAMKMESNVSAPVSGKVKRVCVVQGDRYVAQLLLSLSRIQKTHSLVSATLPQYRTR